MSHQSCGIDSCMHARNIINHFPLPLSLLHHHHSHLSNKPNPITQLIYLFNPLNLSFAPSNTSSSLQTANRNHSSPNHAFPSV